MWEIPIRICASYKLRVVHPRQEDMGLGWAGRGAHVSWGQAEGTSVVGVFG